MHVSGEVKQSMESVCKNMQLMLAMCKYYGKPQLRFGKFVQNLIVGCIFFNL
jgi:hypothetical protein